ncbi:sugar phosphate isomerase/epimerase family protein [Allokutzneria albata]|uniref:Sugar phosphate isomerase/epimerase n=1 Tax=Allokutzneria albata TaxID=211114 RepID=A0A1G9ZPD8_ALLAB|nr:TIM barrel protein [Allokutzneria albata]SDN22861.1 Sugar phosphate isomerase/epimerase [Allokutzneria albata]
MIIPGLVSVTFRHLDVPRVVELVTEAGLSAVEWGGDVHVPSGDVETAELVRAQCASAGITVAGYGSYYRAGASDPSEVERALRTAVALGAPRVRVWAGTWGSGQIAPAKREEVVSALRLCALAAADEGIEVALEFHRNTLTDTLESTKRLLAEIDMPNVTSYWQPRGAQDTEEAVDEVRALLPNLPTVHVFSWGAGWGDNRLPLGERADLWEAVLPELAADGVDRYALLEFVPDDHPAAFRRDAGTLLGWLDRLR